MKQITVKLLGFKPRYDLKIQKIDPSYTCRWDIHTLITMPKSLMENILTWTHEFTEITVFGLIDEVLGYGSNNTAHLMAGFSCGAAFRLDRFTEPVKILNADQYWSLFQKGFALKKKESLSVGG